MYRIIDGRGSGKTSRLMLLAKETGAAIACSNPWAMAEKAKTYGIVGIDFISYEDLFYKDDFTIRGRKILIDEIENFIQYLLSGKLIGYTLSNED